MYDQFESLSNKKLKKLIKKTKETLNQLNEELERRKLEKRHEEIDHLEDHMTEVENRFTNFITFVKTIMDEKK